MFAYQTTIYLLRKFLCEWRQVKEIKSRGNVRLWAKLHPTDMCGKLQILDSENVMSTTQFFETRPEAGYGAIVQDTSRTVMASFLRQIQGCWTP